MATDTTPPDVMNKRSILLPIDNTNDSENALQWVLDNMYREGDEIHLFHVIPLPMPEIIGGIGGLEGVVTTQPDPKEDQRHVEEAREFVAARFVPKLQGAGAPYKLEVVRFLTDNDSIGEAVCKRAESINACAIVVASHNRGALKEFFLGSVSKHISSHSKVAVVVLH